jgi:hypothetical protein
MAKKAAKTVKKAAGQRGGGSIEAQIARLAEAIGKKGIAEAEKLQETYNHDVIRYAFKTLPKRTGVAGLGSRIEGLLENLDADEAEEIRAKLLQAKAGQ